MKLGTEFDGGNTPEPSFEGVDLNDSAAVADAYLAGQTGADEAPAEAPVGEAPETTETTTVPEASETTIPEPSAEASGIPGSEPSAPPESVNTFTPVEYEWNGQKYKAESPEDVRLALQQKHEFGRQVRNHADEQRKWREERTELDAQTKLLQDYRDETGPLLEGIRGNPELGKYIHEELGLGKTVDPQRIVDNERMSLIEQRLDKGDEQERQMNAINVLDSTRRERFGYQAPISREEIGVIEQYAEQNGVSRGKLYSNPVIVAGIYSLLVGMGSLAYPPPPKTAQPPGETVRQQAAQTAHLPPSTSAASTQQKPLSHKGKTPDDVLLQMKASGDFPHMDDEVLAKMGVEVPG